MSGQMVFEIAATAELSRTDMTNEFLDLADVRQLKVRRQTAGRREAVRGIIIKLMLLFTFH